MTFLLKPYGEWDEIEKPIFVKFSDEGSDDEDSKPVLANNRINDNCNVVSNDSASDVEAKKPFLCKIEV